MNIGWGIEHHRLCIYEAVIFSELESSLFCPPLHTGMLRKIRERQRAVAELSKETNPVVPLLKSAISKLPDLERLLCSAYQGKVITLFLHTCLPHAPKSQPGLLCTMLYLSATAFFLNSQCSPGSFVTLAKALQRVQEQIASCSDMALSDLTSPTLLSLFKEVS